MLDLHKDSQKEVYMRMVGTLTFYMLFGIANFLEPFLTRLGVIYHLKDYFLNGKSVVYM